MFAVINAPRLWTSTSPAASRLAWRSATAWLRSSFDEFWGPVLAAEAQELAAEAEQERQD
jgi:hypothetical protein